MLSRLEEAEQVEEDVYYPPLPEEVRYLVEYLQALDYVEPGMAGPVRLGFGEIESWARLNGVRLNPWEAKLLRQLSSEFARELSRSGNPAAPAPWSDPHVLRAQAKQRDMSKHIKSVLRGGVTDS